MCTEPMHRSLSSLVDPFNTFHLLRTYNRLVGPVDIAQYYNLSTIKEPYNELLFPSAVSKSLNNVIGIDSILQRRDQSSVALLDVDRYSFQTQSPNRTTVSSTTCPASPPPPQQQQPPPAERTLNLFVNDSRDRSDQPLRSVAAVAPPVNPPNNPLLSLGAKRCDAAPSSVDSYQCLMGRRQRGEKRPIPDEQKDDKYFERRKRNNEAAKKSRDARKMREDRIAFRAAVLEQENSILRSQMIALRDEVTTLRQMLCSRPPPGSQMPGTT